MSRRDAKNRRSHTDTPSTGHRLLAGVFLVVALAASAMLVAHHLGGGLPGCGPESACDSLARTVWGRVPGIGFPTAHVGLAFFAALLAGWGLAGGRLVGGLKLVALLGGLVSLLLLGVMVAEQKLCPYCLVAHLGNLAFLAVSFVGGRSASGRSAGAAPKGLMAFGGAFVVLTAILAIVESQTQAARDAAAEAERAESVSRMTQAAQGDLTSQDPEKRWGDLGFRGRFLHGPETAPIRIVMLTDYQCPDCRQVEEQIRKALETRDDIQLSIKHFPMCREAGSGELCNKYLSRTLHRNACWAARAAEAAGMVGGDQKFFDMHFWLFDKEGSFTREELDAQVAKLGLDSAKFYAAMEGAESLARVRADIEDGHDLGLYFTPMVFVNGIELKGWQAPTAVSRTIADVAAANPPARKAGSDVPAFAREKFVSDWEDSGKRRLPADNTPRYFGASPQEGASVIDVVIWGDYQEENTAAVDADVRKFLEGRSDLRYHFRHYPVDPSCNKTLPENVPATSIHPRACWAAQVAEAAGKIGGAESFQRAHVWLMEHWDELDTSTLEDVAQATQLRLPQLEAAMNDPAVQAAIDEDARAAQSLGARSIPLVYIDGKFAPRVRMDNETVITWMLEAATSGRR